MKKPSIRIFDVAFNLLAEIDNYESLQFTQRFYRAGEFEMHISLDKAHVDKLQKDNFILINNQAHKNGIIQYRQIEQDAKGIDILVIKGPTLGGILDRRVTVTDSYDRVRGPAETVLKHYINNHLINPADANRKIPFVMNALSMGRGRETPWQTRYEPLNKVIQEISEFCDIGWRFDLSTKEKKAIFDVIQGRNLSVDQNGPRVIFSREYDNIESQSYVDSDNNYKNVGYAGGKGEDEDRLVLSVGTGTGFNRREVFMDCSSAADAAELVELGNQKLSDHKIIRTFNGMMLNTGSFIFEKDWDLGDIVTIPNKKWGLAMNSRITEVKEIYEPASRIEIALGDEIPTITQFVKNLRTDVKRSG